MEEISSDQGLDLALTSLLSSRLALLCGAGLSMASPSNLPSAAAVAAEAKRRYDAKYGATRASLAENIDDQAEFFFQRSELNTVYLRTFIDPNTFVGQPNAGHAAIADLLLTRAIDIAVSTNVDSLIEVSGTMLYGQIGSSFERDVLATLPPGRAPLLKIHGCWATDPATTIWARGQLSAEPFARRISENKEWLAVRLLDRDLIIVGYWSDWDYLNEILERTLGNIRPTRVVVVDPSDGAWLSAKAPCLEALGQRATASFVHVRQSGDQFLNRLRVLFSESFVRQVLYRGADAYASHFGIDADPVWREPPSLAIHDLWQTRRDIEGRLPNHPASDLDPPDEPLLGLTLVLLRSRGATPDGPYWMLNGQRIRVLRASNQMLHEIQAKFARETPPAVAAEIIIAVGAENQRLPANIARANTNRSIARANSGRWLTRAEAVEDLRLC